MTCFLSQTREEKRKKKKEKRKKKKRKKKKERRKKKYDKTKGQETKGGGRGEVIFNVNFINMGKTEEQKFLQDTFRKFFSLFSCTNSQSSYFIFCKQPRKYSVAPEGTWNPIHPLKSSDRQHSAMRSMRWLRLIFTHYHGVIETLSEGERGKTTELSSCGCQWELLIAFMPILHFFIKTSRVW